MSKTIKEIFSQKCTTVIIPRQEGMTFLDHLANVNKYKIHDFIPHPKMKGIHYCKDCGTPKKSSEVTKQ